MQKRGAKATASDNDSPWKDVLERFFPACLAFFFPDAHTGIDWTRGYEFLDKELQKLVPDAKQGRRLVDKLVKVWRNDGAEIWVLIHIEVQGQPEDEFAQRMYVYNYRLFDKHERNVASFAVLTDEDANWRPDEFAYSLWGTEVRLKFATVKLLDYASRWETLEKDTNPFAIVVMAHLKTLETRRRPKSRLEWKVNIVRSLYERGYSRQEIIGLFLFIDWIMALPPKHKIEFDDEVRKIERGKKMAFVSDFERRAVKRGMVQGIEKGIERGTLQTLRETILDILATRFGAKPENVAALLQNIEDTERLRELQRRAVTLATLAEFEEGLEA